MALNHAADEFAEIASARAQLPPNILKDFKYMDMRAWAVQKRILAANEIAATQTRSIRPPPR